MIPFASSLLRSPIGTDIRGGGGGGPPTVPCPYVRTLATSLAHWEEEFRGRTRAVGCAAESVGRSVGRSIALNGAHLTRARRRAVYPGRGLGVAGRIATRPIHGDEKALIRDRRRRTRVEEGAGRRADN